MSRPFSPRLLSTHFLLTAAMLTSAGITGCNGCGDKPTDPNGIIEVDSDRSPLELAPLPTAPAVAVEKGALPGIPTGPLAVVVSRPQGQLRGNERPTISFNKPVVPLGAAENEQPIPADITPAIKGQWRWIGSASVEFLPDAPLPYATSFTVTPRKDLVALDGEALAAATPFTFSTLPLELSTSQPYRNWPWFDADEPLKLYFNQPVQNIKDLGITAGGQNVAYTVKGPIDTDTEAAAKTGRKPEGRTAWGQRTRYEVSVTGKVPPGSNVVVDLAKLRAAEGPEPTDLTTLAFHARGAMQIKDIRLCQEWDDGPCPTGPVMLTVTNPVDVDSFPGKIHITPKGGKEVTFDVDDIWQRTDSNDRVVRLTIPSQLQPGTVYDIVVDAGLKDEKGNTAAGSKATVTTGDIDPWLSSPASHVLLERHGDGALPFDTANIKKVNLELTALTPSTMATLLADWRAKPAGGSPQVLEPKAKKNQIVRTPFKVLDHLPSDGPKLFALRTSSPDLTWQREPSLTYGQITDLGVHVKVGATAGVAWVTSLKTGSPVAGAKVAVYDKVGAVRFEGDTDKDGLLRLPAAVEMLAGQGGDDDSNWHDPFALVAATLGDDTGVTLSTWDGPVYIDQPRGWDGDIPDVEVVMFAERGIYRPGEEVFVKGVVRSRTRGTLHLPEAGSTMRLRFSDEDGGKAKELTVKLSRFGTFSSTFTLPESARLGWWRAFVSGKLAGRDINGSTNFRVEQYRKPQFKVDVRVPTSLIAGEAMQARTEARYLFGGPMPGANATTTITRDTAGFSPEGFSGFDFGVQTWWYDDDEPRPTSEVYARQRGVIADDGNFVTDVGNVATPAGFTWRYTVETEVQDVNRQTVANRASTLVHPASTYVGVNVKGGFGEVGKETTINIVGVNVDGSKQANRPVDVVIKHRQWKSIRKKDPALGRYVLVSEAVEEKTGGCAGLTTAVDAVACKFSPTKAGLHVVEASITDEEGRVQRTKTSFYVSGSGWVSWGMRDDDRVDLVLDKAKYAPGETAKVLIKSPWPSAEAIITTEREGVRTARRIQLKGAATAVDIPITDDDIPNIYASVVMVRGRIGDDDAQKTAAKGELDPGRPQVKVGWINLPVEKDQKRLRVSLDAGAGSHRPGQKIKVKLAVKDNAGNGVPAEVTVWAVDEGVLRLTSYTPPDILEAFHRQRGLSVRYGESLIHLVRKTSYGIVSKGDPGGGGGSDAGSGFRSNFKTTAFFKPDVVADASGNATFEVTLPDDLTTYRLMAIAVGTDDRFGAGGGEIVVKKPVMALPALPRFARVGDVFEAGVVIHTANPGDVDVVASAEGVVIQGDATRRVTMAGKGVEVRFPFKAEGTGPARLRFTATQQVAGTAEKDGVQMIVPVTLPTVLETTAVSGMTDSKVQEGLKPPGESRVDVGGLDIVMGSTALAGFNESMKQLVDYPHGCLEQMASRLVPFIALRELQGGFGTVHPPGSEADIAMAKSWFGDSVLDKDGTPHPDKVVKASLAKMVALQQGDGSFRMWPTSSCVDPWASTYATLSLVRAREVGYDVDEAVIDRALRFLDRNVVGDKLPSCWNHPRKASDLERTFAAFVLARAGKAKTGALGSIVDRVLKNPDTFPLFGRALLADALVVGKGDPATAQKVLQTVLNTARETPREVHFEEPDGARYRAYWSSDVRTSAIVLMTLVDAVPEHPFIPKIAAYLRTIRQADGRFRTTQDAAFALMAMSEVVRAKEATPPSYHAVISVNGAPLVSEDFKGRSLDVVTKHITMADVVAKGSGDLPFIFEKEGTGTLYYAALLRRAPKVMPTEPLERGFTVQRWFEPMNHPGQQTRTFYAGDLVRVRVRVATRDARRSVAIDVPLPAGLEIVDTTLGSTASNASDNDDDTSDGEEEECHGGDSCDPENLPFAGFWSPFDYTEKRDDRYSAYADELPPGLHTISFVARATTMGTFVLPPAEASEMYAPEVFGRSDAGTFKVVSTTAP